MHYKFPIIETIDDVKFALDSDYFVVADRGDHTIINYQYASPEVFPEGDSDLALMRREFRGLIFDSEGNIIRRPFHKFFNVGERLDHQISNIDLSKPHIIYDKLDGSMISPYRVGLDIIWGTKMGDTDVAKQVLPHVEKYKQYFDLVNDCLDKDVTPIFEWCSRKQRIVVDYPEDILALTAARNMKSGEYLEFDVLYTMASMYGVVICSTLDTESFSQDFIDKTRKETEGEGYIISFDCGNKVKIKNDHYCNLHRVKSDIASEKGVVKLMLSNGIDDVKPLIYKEDLKDLERYEESFWEAVDNYVKHVKSNLSAIENSGIDRKTFALCDTISWDVKNICFNFFGLDYNSKEIRNKILRMIEKNLSRNSKFLDFKANNEFLSKIPNWKEIKIDE